MDPAMANNVTISVNGEAMEVPSGTTVAALLQLLDVETAQIAVELDGNVAQRKRWREISITPGATLEIVRFVGGGYAFSTYPETGVGRIGK
jgi:sulfur carrier protein